MVVAIDMQNLRKMLNKIMYKDLATVKRATREKVGKADEWTQNYKTVYRDIPCKLSQMGASKGVRTERSMTIRQELRLNYDPHFEILPNDLVEVTTHNGQTFKLFAGVSMVYVTHKLTELKRVKEAGQK